MTRAYVLIEADEGDFGDRFTATSLEGMVATIRKFYDDEVAGARFAADRAYYSNLCRELLVAVGSAPLEPGEYRLRPATPHWQPWLLFIVETP